MSSAQRRLDAAFLRAYRANALSAQGGYCRYCFEPLTRKSVTADHRVPQSKGGKDHQHNIAACCVRCNRAKGSMSERAFLSAINANDSAPVYILLTRFRRRMWLRTHLACTRIATAAGIEYHGPRRKAA